MLCGAEVLVRRYYRDGFNSLRGRSIVQRYAKSSRSNPRLWLNLLDNGELPCILFALSCIPSSSQVFSPALLISHLH